MRLRYQLFLALLLASAVLVVLMAAIGSYRFDRGFLGYVNALERERLAPLVEALADGYAREDGWDWIAGDERVWRETLRESLGRRSGRRPPERGSTRRRPFVPDLLLADAEGRPLVGRRSPDGPAAWLPIEVGGATVGRLRHRSMERLPGGLDAAFAASQQRGFLLAALAMVPVSALLAIGLAGRVVRPLTDVADAVERIGRGEYAHRLPAARRDELGALSRDINRLAATLESSLEARRRWLAEISHELRTPVAVLRGELEAIQDGVQALDAEAVDSLHAETLRLARLIDDLHALTLSDAGALDYRFERLALGEVVVGRIDAGGAAARAAALDLELRGADEPLPVHGDRQRLGQLVDNLLQNSLRYTDPGGRVRATLSREAGRAVLDWSDSAPGVDAEHLSRLFEPLYRAEASRSRDAGGDGLGLAIASRIVEAHGGTIAARAADLGGLAVRVELPLANGAPS